MASITAHGASELCRLKARSKARAEYTYIYVLASDGRVLVRSTGMAPSGYSLLGKQPAGKRTEKELRELIRRMGREVY